MAKQYHLNEDMQPFLARVSQYRGRYLRRTTKGR